MSKTRIRPLVKKPLLTKTGKIIIKEYRVGRGFSLGEIQKVGLSVKEARILGIYVDKRRKSIHEENINILKKWIEQLKKNKTDLYEPTLPKTIIVKRDLHKVFKGKTMSGRKCRGLLSIKYRYTHNYKWKRKHKQRILRKRHEGKRYKGGD